MNTEITIKELSLNGETAIRIAKVLKKYEPEIWEVLKKEIEQSFVIPKVNSTLQVLPFEGQLTKIIKEIHILEDSYINADECGNISDKIYIGKELKRLRKERENL